MTTLREPTTTALLLLVLGALLAISVVSSSFSSRIGIPAVLIFLLIGMLAGSEGIGGIEFDSYPLAYRVGNSALALILFDGGLHTPLATVRRHVGPAATLATVGVVITALVVAGGAVLLGFPWTEALLLGSIVSSTDAAAVFSVLRGSGIQLKKRVGGILELEAGLNDPVAVILTVSMTAALTHGTAIGFGIVPKVLVDLVVGTLVGAIFGYGGRYVLAHLKLSAGGLYPVMTVACALLSFSSATLAHGSGFLAVYVAGVLIGNGTIPYHSAVLRIHDFMAWLSQVIMFLALGLLVYPTRLVPVAGTGIAVALMLVFVARPLGVFLSLLPFRFPLREVGYVSWVGLRGAVPIVLATYPVLAGARLGPQIFDVIFFVVVLSAILQGGTVRYVTARLGLQSDEPPLPPAILEITSTRPLPDALMTFHIGRASAVCNARIADLPFPEGAAAMLIVRGETLIAPRGDTELLEGDHLYIFTRPEDRGLMILLFGRRGEE